MPITITSVKRIERTPLSLILVKGEAPGCESLNLASSCSGNLAPVVVQGGHWEAEIANTNNCPCGSAITITANCTHGNMITTSLSTILNCGDCRTLSISELVVSDCDQKRNREVQFNLIFSPPIPMGSTAKAISTRSGTSSTETIFDFISAQSDISSYAYSTKLQPLARSSALDGVLYSYVFDVTLTDSGGGSHCLTLTKIGVNVDPCTSPGDLICPSIAKIDITSGCFDPAARAPVKVQFVATTDDPSHLISGYEWDFGDTAPGASNHARTTIPEAEHNYTGTGDFPVKLTLVHIDACTNVGPKSIMTTASVRDCPCPNGQTRNADGKCVAMALCPPGQQRNAEGKCVPTDPIAETLSCFVLRLLAPIFGALAIVSAFLAFCFTPLPPLPPFWPLIIIAAVFALVAVIVFILWLKQTCPRPCAWGLLMIAQLLIGAGWGGVFFAFCCPWLGWLGLVLLGVGIGLLGLWISECKPSPCGVISEIGFVLFGVAIPVIGFVMIYPPAQVCALQTHLAQGSLKRVLASILHAGLDTVSAGLGIAASACAKPKGN